MQDCFTTITSSKRPSLHLNLAKPAPEHDIINIVNIDEVIFGDTMYSVLRHGCVYDPKTSLNDFTRALLGEGRPFLA